MSGAVGKRRDDARGQHRGEPGVERQPAALGELQHHDRDERLHDAAGAEAVGRAHRVGRRHASRGRRRRSRCRAWGCPRAGSLPGSACSDRGGRRAAPAGAGARGPGQIAGHGEPPPTCANPYGARGAARPGGSKPAGRAQQQRPAVDQAPAQAIRKRANVAVWDSIIRRVHGPRSLDSVVARPPWARRVTPSVLIATVSRCTPRTTIESPGSAASTAPRIEPPPPATKRRPRAEPVKTIQLVASTTGTANSRADRRTRLPIALENRPRLSSNQPTKQAANPSRPQNVARTQTRAGAQAQPPASHGRARGRGAGCCLETQHAEETSLARFMCAAGGAATRAPPLSGQGDDLDLI